MNYSSFSVSILLAVRTGWLSNSPPLCECTTLCLSIHQLMGIWSVSNFGLLWVTQQCTFLNKFLCRNMFSVLLGKHLGVEFLGHMVALYFTFWGIAKQFLKESEPLYNPPHPPSNIQELQLLHILAYICYYLFFLILVILVGMKWYVTTAWIFIFLITINVKHLCIVYWAFAFLFWKNIYSGHLF